MSRKITAARRALWTAWADAKTPAEWHETRKPLIAALKAAKP